MRIKRMKACLNGGRDCGDHPAVPLAPAELAASAAAAVAAGAEAVPGWAELCELLRPAGIAAEAGIWSVADADELAAAGQAIDWLRVVKIIDVPADRAAAAADEILSRLDDLTMTAPRLLHGEGTACWPLIAHAGMLGLPTRIGLEDTTTGPEGSAVSGNAELVRLALSIWQASATP